MPTQTGQKKKTTGRKAFHRYMNQIDASSEEESNEVAPKTPPKKQRKEKGLCVPFSIRFPSRIWQKSLDSVSPMPTQG